MKPTLKTYTFAIRTTHPAIQKLQKSMPFAPLNEKKNKSTKAQHCISVMRAKQVKLSFVTPNKICGKPDSELLQNPALRLYLTVIHNSPKKGQRSRDYI